MIIKLRKSKHNDLHFLSVYEGDEMTNDSFIMSAFDTKENLDIELQYWFKRFIEKSEPDKKLNAFNWA